jgi:hypothetical protein
VSDLYTFKEGEEPEEENPGFFDLLDEPKLLKRPSMSDRLKGRIELIKKDPKRGVSEIVRDIFFGHMDNCTDLYEHGSKELEECIIEAIRKDGKNLNVFPPSWYLNFKKSQADKDSLINEINAKKKE